MLCQELDIHIYMYMTLSIIDMDFLYQFNLRLIASLFTASFHEIWGKKVFQDFQKLVGLWLVGEMDNHVGIYGSKVAEGFSAFQRRSCSNCGWKFDRKFDFFFWGWSFVRMSLQSLMIWHEIWGISNHYQFDCLFNNLYRLTRKKSSKLYVSAESSYKGPVMWKVLPCHDTVMIDKLYWIGQQSCWLPCWYKAWFLYTFSSNILYMVYNDSYTCT